MENIKEIYLIITLVVGTLFTFFMAGIVIYSVVRYQKRVLQQKDEMRDMEQKFQNELLEATLLGSEKEREALGKNIHDEIGTLLNVIKNNNMKIKNNLDNSDVAREVLSTNNKLILEINENVRSISNDLISPTLNRLGFVRALDQLCNQISDTNSLKVSLECNFEDIKRFEPRMEVQLYRVCKELINNILKHSHSTELKIEKILSNETLFLKMSYNGKGINNEDIQKLMRTSKGLGVKSIMSRMQIINGKIDYQTPTNGNALIMLQVPAKVIENEQN